MSDAGKRLTTYLMLGSLTHVPACNDARDGDEHDLTPCAECTCGHYYDDHVGDVCQFYGCGCGYGLGEGD